MRRPSPVAASRGWFWVAIVLAFLLLKQIDSCGTAPGTQPKSAKLKNPIERILSTGGAEQREGTAAAILVDTSGSMEDPVADADGINKPKIEIARRAVVASIRRFADFAQQNPGKPVLVAVYEFSRRNRQPSCRRIIDLAAPDAALAAVAVNKMVPDGGTPIGDAMITAKRDLDASGMSHRHILVVSDGQNNVGYSPGDVALAIARQADKDRASIYFVAFDVEANTFNAVKEAGGLVLAASSETDLNQTLDFIVTGKILVEQPSSPAR